MQFLGLAFTFLCFGLDHEMPDLPLSKPFGVAAIVLSRTFLFLCLLISFFVENIFFPSRPVLTLFPPNIDGTRRRVRDKEPKKTKFPYPKKLFFPRPFVRRQLEIKFCFSSPLIAPCPLFKTGARSAPRFSVRLPPPVPGNELLPLLAISFPI